MEQDTNWLRQKAREWAIKVVELHKTDVPPEMIEEKKALLRRAKKIKDSVEKVIGPVAEFGVMNQYELGLGPVAVIGALGIGAVGALIYKWNLDAKAFIARRNDINRLIESGMSPKAAAEVVSSYSSSPLKETLGETKNLIGIAALAFLGYKLIKG